MVTLSRVSVQNQNGYLEPVEIRPQLVPPAYAGYTPATGVWHHVPAENRKHARKVKGTEKYYASIKKRNNISSEIRDIESEFNMGNNSLWTMLESLIKVSTSVEDFLEHWPQGKQYAVCPRYVSSITNHLEYLVPTQGPQIEDEEITEATQ